MKLNEIYQYTDLEIYYLLKTIFCGFNFTRTFIMTPDKQFMNKF